MWNIIFNQVIKRLFPGKTLSQLTMSQLRKAESEAIQIMNRTKGKKGEVIQFPSGGIHNIPVEQQFTPPGSREIFEVLDDDAYQALKGDYYLRLIANTDDDIKALAKRVVENKQDVKLERLTKDQRKDMLTMIDDRIKMGNRKFMQEYDSKFPVDEDFASGGIARVGMVMGGQVWKKFIEKLFIKASNQIRQGKGKWAGLTQPQWIKQHDDLTKMLKKWEQGGKKGLPQGAEQFIGMNDLQVTKAIKEAEKKVKKPRMTGDENLDYDWKETPEGWVKVPGSEGAFYRFGKKHKDFIDKGVSKMVGGVDERTALKQKYPGISDDLLNKILIDDNPQRKAEVLATMDEYLKLREVGKGETEAYDIITKSIKDPTKHASGGIAGELHLNDGGRVSFTKGGKVSSGLAHVLGV
jgi:hypothetical protein